MELYKRFGDWVDSFGEDAGDYMMAGMVVGAIVAGAVCVVVAIALESAVLLGLGFVVLVGHVLFAMAVL